MLSAERDREAISFGVEASLLEGECRKYQFPLELRTTATVL